MASKLNLDLTKIQSESSSMFSRVPSGTYKVVLAHSQFKETVGGAGLILGYMVEEGEHTGKMIQDFVNIQNQSEKAVEIGLGRIKKIMEVQKRKDFKLTTDEALISATPFMIDVITEEGEYQGKSIENNKIKKIYLAENASPERQITNAPAPKKEKVVEAPKKDLLPWEVGYEG